MKTIPPRMSFAAEVRAAIVRQFGFGDEEPIEVTRPKGWDWEARVIDENDRPIVVRCKRGELIRIGA